MKKKYTVPDPKFICQAFDSISPRYDLLNQVLSFGMSESWRKRSARIILSEPGFSPKSILDLGCGTGKFLECFLRSRAWEHAVGVDFSSSMLQRARETIPGNVLWLQEDFEALPFLESSFDLIISGFTLRSVQKLPEFLGTVYRVLRPGGKAAFLDLTLPPHPLARMLCYPYLRFFLPIMGWLLSGNRAAYDFLSGSVRSFPPPENTIRLMKTVGFRECDSKCFAFGAATLIIGGKSLSES
ncbi:MAG TPA: ubiquinone/menaquinone biosynthesis methyltransferase [Candidatus Omnitrophota bacterium]|nr:ubiquinone/menaquinone biosynthesis methyltransferase [Candidatus Omnitrophota bacterium]